MSPGEVQPIRAEDSVGRQCELDHSVHQNFTLRPVFTLIIQSAGTISPQHGHHRFEYE
jgi:hypothetical protein